MFNMSEEEYANKKLDFAVIRTKAISRCVRAWNMRVNALNMRYKSQIMRNENRNLRARIKEWDV